MIWLAQRHVPESRAPGEGPLDWVGSALAVLAAALLTLGLTALAEPGGGRLTAALVLAGIAATAAFVRAERRAASPLVPLGLFASRAFTGANVMTLFLYGALTGVLFLLPFEMIGRRGMSASAAGLVLLPLGLIIGLFARPAGTLADRIGVRPMLIAGSSLVAAAALLLALGLPGLAGGLLGPVILLSCGMALVVAPLTAAVMNAAPDALAGAASGVSNAASRLAALFAVALVGTLAARVFAWAAGDEGARFGVLPAPDAPAFQALDQAFALAWRTGMLACAATAALAAIVAALMLPGRRPG